MRGNNQGVVFLPLLPLPTSDLVLALPLDLLEEKVEASQEKEEIQESASRKKERGRVPLSTDGQVQQRDY